MYVGFLIVAFSIVKLESVPNNIIDATWQKLYSVGNRIFGSLGL